jgi:hypothetical protein
LLFAPELLTATVILGGVITLSVVYFKFYKPAVLMFKLRGFFRLRDEFVFKSIVRRKEENKKIASYFVDNINAVIRDAEDYHLDNLLRHIEIRNKEVENERELKQLISSIKKADPELRELASEYYQNLLVFIVTNSSLGMVIKLLLKTLRLYSVDKVTQVYLKIHCWLSFLIPGEHSRFRTLSNLDSVQSRVRYSR